MTALTELQDGDAAELGIIEIYKTQSFRPSVADVVEAYKAQIRLKPAEVPAALLAPRAGIPATPTQAWSIEGAQWAAGIRGGLREEDVVRFEQQAQESYLALGETSSERAAAVMERMHTLVDREEPGVGGDSAFGKVCPQHNRWVGNAQTKDPCFEHVHRNLVPEDVDPDEWVSFPPCNRCGGVSVGECGHLAEEWANGVTARTKALLKKRAIARDKRRALQS